jgi:hypothetical protein
MRPGLVVSLAGLGVLWLVSSAGAAAIAKATNDASRWLVLAALARRALVFARSERMAWWQTGGLSCSGHRGRRGHGARVAPRTRRSHLFLAERLTRPRGYVNAEATTFLMGFRL